MATPNPKISANDPHVLAAIATNATDITIGIRDNPTATSSATIKVNPKVPLR